MQELYEGIELTAEQAEWLCRGLLDLAAVDGVDQSEIDLINEFYASETGQAADLDALEAKGFDLDEAPKHLQGEKVVEAFIISSYLLIYADGNHSEEERKRVSEFAVAFDLTPGQLEDLHLKARLYLLQMLATQLRNRDVVRQVGASLGLADDQIAGAWEE